MVPKRTNGDRSRERKTLLFLTAGPYFFPTQRTVRARYELLSEHYDGFILSFVSEAEWQTAAIGRFTLIGQLISGRSYRLLPMRLLRRVWLVLWKGLLLHLFTRRIDVIIAYDPFMTGLLGYLLSRIIGARLIVEVNNDFGNSANWSKESWDVVTYLKSAFIRLVAPFVLNRADTVKLLYEGQIASFPRLKRELKYAQFHDFVATRLFTASPLSQRRILFLGHPWYVKGLDVLVKAFNRISRDFPDWELRIVGHLPEKLLYKDLYEGNPRISFGQPVMPDDVITLMTECSAVVLASRSEGMPRVLIEAMASGRPIIASRVGGIPHYIEDGETGLLFDREDAEGLAAAMHRLLGSPSLAERLGESGRQYVERRLSDTCWVAAMRQLVERACR